LPKPSRPLSRRAIRIVDQNWTPIDLCRFAQGAAANVIL